MGHDHKVLVDSVVHPHKTTYLVNPANDAIQLSHIEVNFCPNCRHNPRISPAIISLEETPPTPLSKDRFKAEYDAVKAFVNQPVGYITEADGCQVLPLIFSAPAPL